MKTFNIGAKCRYKLYVYSGDGTLKRESEWCPNMVLDLGIAGLLGHPSYLTTNLRAVCGTGTAPVDPEDASLDVYLQGAQAEAFYWNTYRETTPTPFVRHTWRWRFNQGSVVGNVSEVGVALSGFPNSSTPLLSRALVVDSGGDPTTVTVVSDEYLEIEYELYLNAMSGSGSFSNDIEGTPTSTAYTIKPAAFLTASLLGWNSCTQSGIVPLQPIASTGVDYVAFSNGGVSSGIDGNITGTTYRVSTATGASVNVSGGYRDVTYLAGPGEANANITAMQFRSNLFAFQMEVSPAIPKTNEHTYDITIRYQISRSA